MHGSWHFFVCLNENVPLFFFFPLLLESTLKDTFHETWQDSVIWEWEVAAEEV